MFKTDVNISKLLESCANLSKSGYRRTLPLHHSFICDQLQKCMTSHLCQTHVQAACNTQFNLAEKGNRKQTKQNKSQTKKPQQDSSFHYCLENSLKQPLNQTLCSEVTSLNDITDLNKMDSDLRGSTNPT